VSLFTRLRRPRAATLAAALAVALATPAVGGVTGLAAVGAAAPSVGRVADVAPAYSTALGRDSVGAAGAKVRRILGEVHALSAKVRAAEQRYAAALDGVAAGVNQAISAERGQAAVQQLLDTSEQRLQHQVLELYASGGSFVTSASLLSPNGLAQYASSRHAVTSAVAQTLSLEHQQRALAAAAGRATRLSSHRAGRSIATERNVAGVARRVQGLLAQQQDLLGQAQRELSQQKALAAARALAAQQALAAAQAAASAEGGQFAADTTAGVTAVGVLPPSAEYLGLYKKAATTCPGLSWTVLAAIGQVESGHGRNDGPSSAGALGPMQFEPATFAEYAVDGDHDGKTDIMDPADAIYTAARYLCANGAGRGVQALASAIFDYNHAGWYV